jgi:hypothetical protein
MVTLYDIDIELKFYNYDKVIPVEKMAENFDELNKCYDEKLSFKENEDLEFEFKSNNSSDKLYLDGLDLLPPYLCEVDDNGLFYVSANTNKKYVLFSNDNKHYAMSVGTFEFHIVRGNCIYRQIFKILPKQLNSDEWTVMKSDLENEITGLSADLIRRNMSLTDSGNLDYMPPDKLYKFFIIQKHFKNILAALLDLKDKPNYKIVKEYKYEPFYKSINIDYMTIRDYLKRGTVKEKYLIPKYKYDFDLPENRWLKKIINYYKNVLKEFHDSLEKYIEEVTNNIDKLKKYNNSNAELRAKENVLEQLKKYRATSIAILNASNMLKNQEWYSTVGRVSDNQVPHVMIYDARYSAFYKMYKELLLKNFNIKWSQSYTYCWKISSKMYEIWCYIKICRFLSSKELGFKAEGWIFDNIENNMLIPDLISGTMVKFSRDNCIIKVYYDSYLKQNDLSTDKESMPVYSKNRHRRPDVRLDLYKENLYWSSLIFEVKYRTVSSFWSSGDSGCKEQIRAYKNDILSPFCKNYSRDYSIRKLRPIDRVWVLHPSTSENQIIDKSDEGIKFVRLKPNENYSIVIDELKSEIENAFKE